MTKAPEKRLLLLVDDDAENVQVVHSILKDRYKIRAAMNGDKALELAKVEPQRQTVSRCVLLACYFPASSFKYAALSVFFFLAVSSSVG